ncbi:hypothetical protein ABL78_7566 [Leptomonas seymouri]|uniref:Uncharacterized protein n=1 Tax=Leptomonas seymouri TaxID=5684 RepID=A0A0N0P2V4_LEPSE|nr:hypothetical protein ABL78_7566 [Leptomonas seymouri]|eukprot:KPI83399.1 hypothetical protein ABL78_7566 [Leptomonas seymouri]
MTSFLQAQETTMQRLFDACVIAPQHPGAEVSSSRAAQAGGSAQYRKATALQPSGSNINNSSPKSSRENSALQHRARIVSELLKRDRESQLATAVGRTAVREQVNLKRVVELEEERLTLAQKRNAALRARLATLTRERSESANSGLPNHCSTALAVPANQHAQLAALGAARGTASDYTNEIVEARRVLDQRTKELQESRERLLQLQQHHLDQLSGRFRPTLTAGDTLRTTENFLDTEMNMAVCSTVVDALLEVNQALKPLFAGAESGSESGAVLPFLENVNALWDRLAVQNFVVGRINRLFTCMCPTAPPLTLLKDTNMM